MKDRIAWSTASAALSKLVSILTFIILARKLPPEDFGVLAIATILFGFIRLFSEAGYKESIIYYQTKRDSRILPSLFLWLLAINLVFVVLLHAFGGAVSSYFDMELDDVFLLMTILLPFVPARIIGQSLLESELSFKAIAYVEFATQLVASSISISMAYAGYGVVSLFALFFLYEFLQALTYIYISRWRFAFCFSWEDIKGLLSYSSYLIIFEFVNYITENIDKFLIGKTIGSGDLGIYHRSQQVTLMPAMFMSQAVGRVLFPYMVRAKSETAKIRSIHIQTLDFVFLLVTPLMTFLVVFSDDFVNLLLGPQWYSMGFLLKMFTVMGCFQVAGFLSINVYKSTGKTKIQNNTNYILKSILLIAVVVGVNFGLIGLTLSLLSARIINFFITQFVISKLIKIRTLYLFKHILSFVTVQALVVSLFIIMSENILVSDQLSTIFIKFLLYVIIMGSMMFTFFGGKYKYIFSMMRHSND